MKTIRAAAGFAIIVLAGSVGVSAADVTRPDEVPSAQVLKQIFDEVKELGPYPGETFIKHEFFLGPADDDSYKREHVVVIIQVVGGVERMRIQVTDMKTRPDNPRIQLAGRAWAISCSVNSGGRLAILRSDYSDQELARVAPDILRAVREKKKLLKEFKAKDPAAL